MNTTPNNAPTGDEADPRDDNQRSYDDETESWSRHVEADVDESAQILSSEAPSRLADETDHEDGDDDDDDDDDEDNWSRQVETDDLQRMPSSITGDVNTFDGDDDNNSAAMLHSGDVIPPRREEPTLKEKLVERERQRRAETERARWKRQFAMAAHTEGDDEENFEGGILTGGDQSLQQQQQQRSADRIAAEDGGMAMRETNSVAGTVGEDTVAHIETLEDESTKMNYPMERFLQEQEEAQQLKKETPREGVSNQGVVMERFLQETPVVTVVDDEATPSHAIDTPTNVQRSVSFDTEHPQSAPLRDFLNLSTASSSIADASTDHARISEGLVESPREGTMPLQLVHSAPGSVANASTTCLPPSEDDHDPDEVPMEIPAIPEPSRQSDIHIRDGALPSAPIVDLSGVTVPVDLHDEPTSPSQPRVLRLTEAEIQEMAAIDEASRSNAPPSERDDMSELGELVSDFGGPAHIDHPNNSQGTPTTAMESASSVANQSGFVPPTADDQLSIDAMGTASVSSHIVTSSVGGDVSIAANPPSDIGRDDDDEDDERGPRDILVSSDMIPVSPPPVDLHEPSQVRPGDTSLPQLDSTSPVARPFDETNDALDRFAADETIVNRTMRPGLFNYKQNLRDDMKYMSHTPSARLKKASSCPDHVISSAGSEHIEDFDFDKNDFDYPHTPADAAETNEMLLRNEMWSSGLSPTNESKIHSQIKNDGPSMPHLPDYGTRSADEEGETQRFGSVREASTSENISPKAKNRNDERRPLLGTVPGEVTMTHRNSMFTELASIRNFDDLNSLAESVFSDVRSEGTSTVHSISNEAQEYLHCSIWQRAFPERLFALTVTLLFEIPVLLMVSGGSDRLCYLIGRTKYQLLLGFLPLSSAVSGNVGLQSSTLTTRAISHGQVKVENYKTWLFKEIGAATYLGLGMGAFLGIIAFYASGHSLAFGLTVMIAQFISILTAGCTGTFAPLIFTFIFERDSGKWGGPLETAVQDIVGSFAMVIISYQILLWMGPFDIAEGDMCGAGDMQ